jgi:FkbM family methyltransferase
MTIDKNLAFDIGAYIGDSISMIKNLGYRDIVCFEPEPNNFKKLFDSYQSDPHITFMQKALSNECSKIEMIVNPDMPILNTLEKYWTENCRHEQYYNKNNMYKCVVETTTLDEYINSIGKIPSYIKLDAEGHGFKILQKLSYKTEMLSFEWVSEFDQINSSCIELLNKVIINCLGIDCID